MKERTCKKCGGNLPEGYKYDLCQHCMNKKAFKAKVGVVVAGGLAAVGGIALAVVKKAIGK